MDDQQRKSTNLFGAYGIGDPSLNVPVTSGGNISLSPYLNFDPAYISSPESQFIFLEGASQRRGRFELAFSQIGGSVLVGAAAGGMNGFLSGLKETQTAQLTGAVRRTQMLNFVAKQGASSAQALGVIALMYSVFGVLLSKSRGVDDEINTLVAGTTTGVLFKSSAGRAACLKGGAVGFGLAAVWCLWKSQERIKHVLDR